MPAYFSLADVLLVTLCSDPVVTKTIPGKVQSYLACAKPIIGALDGEGAKVINESGSGFSVASGDTEGLVGAVLKMSEMNDAERQDMGDLALAYYRQNFDRDRLVSRLEEWMEEMAGGKG
jgi:glycosyltransferase involved in cell wall biosynthesis